jgi:hypothetical protein
VPAGQAPLARVGVVVREEAGGSVHPGEAPAAAEFDPHLRAAQDVADDTDLEAALDAYLDRLLPASDHR